MARQFIEGGISDCVLALGFEKMSRGSLKAYWNDRANPMEPHVKVMVEKRGMDPKAPSAPQIFGNAGRGAQLPLPAFVSYFHHATSLEHMDLFGTKPEQFAKIAYKNHKHSVNNPYAQFQTEVRLVDLQPSVTFVIFLPSIPSIRCLSRGRSSTRSPCSSAARLCDSCWPL